MKVPLCDLISSKKKKHHTSNYYHIGNLGFNIWILGRHKQNPEHSIPDLSKFMSFSQAKYIHSILTVSKALTHSRINFKI